MARDQKGDNTVKGIYVAGRYAELLSNGSKVAETRSRDMLRKLVGERVGIIREGKLIGMVTITGKGFVRTDDFGSYRWAHLVEPGSKYDTTGRGKWLYWVADPEPVEPKKINVTVNHGRAWCEYDIRKEGR